MSTFCRLLKRFLFKQSCPDIICRHHPASGPCSCRTTLVTLKIYISYTLQLHIRLRLIDAVADHDDVDIPVVHSDEASCRRNNAVIGFRAVSVCRCRRSPPSHDRNGEGRVNRISAPETCLPPKTTIADIYRCS